MVALKHETALAKHAFEIPEDNWAERIFSWPTTEAKAAASLFWPCRH